MIRKLRNCNAKVYTDIDARFISALHANINSERVIFYTLNNDKKRAHTLLVLESYKSIVCVVDCDTDIIYLLPRWNYSVTTQSHIRKFLYDYCNCVVTKYDLENDIVFGFAVVFADGFEDNIPYSMRTH